MSGNISMLKRVCETMMRQNNLNSNSTEAVRVLLAIEIILSPSSLSLPAIPASVAAKKYLSASTASSLLFNNSNLVSLTSQKINDKEEVEKKIDSIEGTVTQVAKGAFLEENIQSRDRVKRGREEEEVKSDLIDEDIIRKRLKSDDIKPLVMNATIGVAFGKQSNSDKKVIRGNEEEDDDEDDDSLPDIDIQADPDK